MGPQHHAVVSEHLLSLRHCQHLLPHKNPPGTANFFASSFLQAHRETEAHFTATGMPSQRNQSDSFRYKRAALYQSLKSKV
jgi:hypothetical protein